MNNLVITIDGPSGSGKGTTARGISKKLSLPHVDSGSIYRTVAYYLHGRDVSASDDEKIMQELNGFKMSYDTNNEVLLFDTNVEKHIRSRENSKYAFEYSRNPLIREFATKMQRELLQNGGILDGRDAGSVVAPDADLKIYLDCDVDERTRRRAKQHDITDAEEIAVLRREIIERDKADSDKGAASLHILPESVVVDTTGMSVDEQIDAVYQKALALMKI
jgi:cytidylate kinase